MAIITYFIQNHNLGRAQGEGSYLLHATLAGAAHLERFLPSWAIRMASKLILTLGGEFSEGSWQGTSFSLCESVGCLGFLTEWQLDFF